MDKPSTSGDTGPGTIEQKSTRRDLIRAGAAAAIAGVLGVFGSAQVATGRNGEPVRAGERTAASKTTTLESNKGPAFLAKSNLAGEGIGVRGAASGRKAIGVHGVASAANGETVGVLGESSSAEGTAGRFLASGGGTALDARSPQRSGYALRTRGRLQLTERSGTTQVSGGAEFVIPVEGGLSAGTFVLATLQDHHPGVHVESATVLDADEGLVVVRLSQALSAPATVGWLVLD